MGMEDLLIDITYDPCKFSLVSTFKDGPSSPHPLPPPPPNNQHSMWGCQRSHTFSK
jgi:hypothetical protein